MLSITDITRRFRVHDYVIDTWMQEGLIPQCVWSKGHRYWSSNEINALIAGCSIELPAEASSSIKRFSRRTAVLNVFSGVIAFVATHLTR